MVEYEMMVFLTWTADVAWVRKLYGRRAAQWWKGIGEEEVVMVE